MLEQHQQRPADHKDQPNRRLFAQLLVEHEVGEQNGHEDAQLVNRRDDAGRPILQGFVIAEPAPARGKSCLLYTSDAADEL